MSIVDTPEPHLTTDSTIQRRRSRAGFWVRILVYLLVAGVLGFIAWRIYRNHQQAAANSARQAAELQNRPVPVQVAATEQRPMPIFLTALGTVTPYMSVTVKARVSGELEPVKFTEGQQVRQGETIMVIDPRPYQAALDQAKGTLAHDQALLKDAQVEYARYKALYDAGVTSKETLDADEAAQGQYQGAIEADKAAIETAQLQLDWCTIQSPINGRIGLRLVDPGNIITANTTNLVIINQFQPIAVYFTLPENELPQVLHKLAAERRLPVDAYDRGDVQKLASGESAHRRQPDRHHHRNRQAEGRLRQQRPVALSQPVRQYSPGDGKPAQCAGGAVGSHPDRPAGNVRLGRRYGRQRNLDRPHSACEGRPGRGTGHHPGQRPSSRAEPGGGRRGPAAHRADCHREHGSAAIQPEFRPGRRTIRRAQRPGSPRTIR